MYFLDKKSNDRLVTHLASASVDSTVRIWTRQSDFSLGKEKSKFELEQVITAKMNGFALCLKFYLLPISKRMIFFSSLKVSVEPLMKSELNRGALISRREMFSSTKT